MDCLLFSGEAADASLDAPWCRHVAASMIGSVDERDFTAEINPFHSSLALSAVVTPVPASNRPGDRYPCSLGSSSARESLEK